MQDDWPEVKWQPIDLSGLTPEQQRAYRQIDDNDCFVASAGCCLGVGLDAGLWTTGVLTAIPAINLTAAACLIAAPVTGFFTARYAMRFFYQPAKREELRQAMQPSQTTTLIPPKTMCLNRK